MRGRWIREQVTRIKMLMRRPIGRKPWWTRSDASRFDRWIREQITRIEMLEGQSVDSFVGAEMAFRGGEDGSAPVFEDPELPFVQVDPLYLRLATGETVKFVTYQNDDTWGILLDSELAAGEPQLDEGSSDSIYRTRKLEEYPTGLITAVEVSRDSAGEIAEILLGIGDDAILLVSGEVYEERDGTLIVRKGDESILLFRHPELLAAVDFASTQ